MTSDGDALFRAICEQPWEDTPRLMLADWLEENGVPLRAEFIRAQIEAAKETNESRRAALEARASALHQESRGRWTHGSPTGPGVRIGRELRRGFYHKVHFSDENAFRARTREVFNWMPVDTPSMGLNSLNELLESEYASRLVKLSLERRGGGGLGDAGCEAISACPRLSHLAELSISGRGVTDAGALRLANNPHLASLTTLWPPCGKDLSGQARLSRATLDLLKERFRDFKCVAAIVGD